MYREFRRFYAFQKQRWRDALSSLIYQIVFVWVLYGLLHTQPSFRLYYLYAYFILSRVVSIANEELEYEIRSGQFLAFSQSIRSLYKIYLQRAFIYYLWFSMVFVCSFILVFPLLTRDVQFDVSILKILILFSFFAGMFFLFYLGMIWLTVRYKRISVLVDCVNTVFLFYSGFVFPVEHWVTVRTFFEGLVASINIIWRG